MYYKGQTMEKKSFVMRAEWLCMFSALPDADAGAIIKAMIRYTTTGEAGDVSPVHGGILAMMIAGYEQDTARYLETCERNRQNIRARWEKEHTTEYDRIRPNTNEYETIPLDTDKDMEKDMEKDMDGEKDKDRRKGAKALAQLSPDMQAVVDEWNKKTDRGLIPKVSTVTGKRAAALRARLNEHGRETVLHVLDEVFRSSFLRGVNRTQWHASFDFFITAGNFQKIADGNYKDAPKQTRTETQADVLRDWLGGAV